MPSASGIFQPSPIMNLNNNVKFEQQEAVLQKPENLVVSKMASYYSEQIEKFQLGSLTSQVFQRVWNMAFDGSHNLIYLAVSKFKFETP